MRTNRAHGWVFLIALVCAALSARGFAWAQESSSEKKASDGVENKDGGKVQDKKYEIPYWDRSESFHVRATVAVIGEGHLWGALGARMAISESVPTVVGWEFYFDQVLPIRRAYLDFIRDGRPLPDVRAREIRDLKAPDQGLYLAYLQALRRSHSASLEMFQRSADENVKAQFTHLAADPKLYRGKVITVKGKLKTIRAVEAPPMLQPDGMREIFTGWIVGPTPGAPPFAIVFTELPKGIKVSEKLNLDVTFQGYFLSNVLFPADKDRGRTQKDLICPWLVGKTVLVAANQQGAAGPPSDTSNTFEIAGYTVGAIFGISILIGLLNLYFRRTDAKTQAKLAELRQQQQPFALDVETNGPQAPNPDDDWQARIHQ